MASKSFKNFKAAKRYLSSVLFYIKAVELGLKPSYLWDLFDAGLHEVREYLDFLKNSGFIKKSLDVFVINGTLFVSDAQNLKKYMNNYSVQEVCIIDLSQGKEPSFLNCKERTEVMSAILEKAVSILNSHSDVVDIDETECNMTTLFGLLLGYPSLYYFNHQTCNSTFSCLSMVPLIKHFVNMSIKSAQNIFPSCNIQELYCFSIPKIFYSHAKPFVDTWRQDLILKSVELGLCLKFEQSTVIVPYVTM